MTVGFGELQWLWRVIPALRVPAIILGVLLVFATVTQSVFEAPLSITHALARIWDHWLSDFFNLLLSPFPWDLNIDIVEARVLTLASVFMIPFFAASAKVLPKGNADFVWAFMQYWFLPVLFVAFLTMPTCPIDSLH